jgi:hypothetical protein
MLLVSGTRGIVQLAAAAAFAERRLHRDRKRVSHREIKRGACTGRESVSQGNKER